MKPYRIRPDGNRFIVMRQHRDDKRGSFMLMHVNSIEQGMRAIAKRYKVSK